MERCLEKFGEVANLLVSTDDTINCFVFWSGIHFQV